MFYRAALDIGEREVEPNRRFLSCVRFVADVATPAVFYLNAEWSKMDAVRSMGWEINSLTAIQREILEEQDSYPVDPKGLQAPTLVYLVEGSWEAPANQEKGALSGLVIPKREFVLSTSELVHRAHLRDSGLNAQTAILCLAAVGLEIMLPNVAFDLVADEEIERIKEELRAERHAYLEVAAALAEQAFERIKDGDYSDVLRWAESEAAFKLAPKARVIEEATSSMASRQLRKAGYSFWKDGVPAIGAAFFDGGVMPAGAAAAQVALKTLVDTFGSTDSAKQLPEVAYAMKISTSLRKGEGRLSAHR